MPRVETIADAFAGPSSRGRAHRFAPFWLILLVVLFSGCAGDRSEISGAGQSTTLTLTSPPNRLVFQRSLAGEAFIPIAGECPWPSAMMEARLLPLQPVGKPTRWASLGVAKTDGHFQGRLFAKSGWYALEVRARGPRDVTLVTTVERVGVGEVFVVVGHSVAQGGDMNLPGATDDRVNTVAWPTPENQRRDYERTGVAGFLPPLVGTAFTNDVQPAPFGHGTYFWARFGELVAREQNVPVMIFNAAFGGTSLGHWAKSARGESFEHGFVKSAIRMPYINLPNTMERYLKVTGVRAILADQGQNDWPEPDANVVFTNYLTWVERARADLGFPQLAVVVNRQTPPGNRVQIRQAQERMFREVPHCFPGPDYDQLLPGDRPDKIHLGESGAQKAAQLWAGALDARFFKTAVPFQSPEER